VQTAPAAPSGLALTTVVVAYRREGSISSTSRSTTVHSRRWWSFLGSTAAEFWIWPTFRDRVGPRGVCRCEFFDHLSVIMCTVR
jgi:hypothetical protein